LRNISENQPILDLFLKSGGESTKGKIQFFKIKIYSKTGKYWIEEGLENKTQPKPGLVVI
jgi:hypothetical protein